MTKFEDLKIKAGSMQSFLESVLPDEPADLITRLGHLNVFIAQSSQLLADAKYYQDAVVNGAIMEAIQKLYNEKLTPSTINKFVSTAAKEQNYLVNWLDRLNAAATHQIDTVRSIISYKKAEMQLM